ncbi:MAG: alpha-L-rhamnosidase [Planctomycetes bacterium]|nr:alpha-L-rhamnosidase [Planctomycetota bacterium]
MRRTICLLALLTTVTRIVSAQPERAAIAPRLLAERWPAEWISHPTASLKEYGVFHFRRTFDLAERPERFVVHVSADNRYRLFVNGAAVVMGPARGDLDHWRFETIDIAPHLREGRNAIAALVWNCGEHVPFAQVTHQTAFILQGDSKSEEVASTPGGWKVIRDEAYEPLPVDRARLGWAFIVVGPGDRVDASKVPWGWEQVEFDDSSWLAPRRLGRGVPFGVRNFSMQWALVPRPIPPMEARPQRFGRIARRDVSGEPPEAFLQGSQPLEIPADARRTIILDQSHLTTAYPEILVSRGRGATIRMEYAEALVDEKGRKGHRDDVEGRTLRGVLDEFLLAGGEHRLFRPLWLRTFRYLQLEVRTEDEPLTIHDIRSEFTGYPFEEKAVFRSSDPSLEKIWEVGWRTARLCAGENYYDCPYYEQLQYVGDTRIQALISLYVAGDDRLVRNALMHFDNSRIPEGLTASRYPHVVQQIIPTYSLFWISMIHDYWMHRGDPVFVRRFLPGIRGVLEWFEARIDGTGMLGQLEWWNFVDWVPEYQSGEPPGVKDGNSAVVSLTFAYALRQAADLVQAFGQPSEANRWRLLARSVAQATLKQCWDAERGLIADTPEKKLFSQHTNVMAVLVDHTPGGEPRPYIERIAGDGSLVQCTFYYRFYLVRALQKAGLASRYIEMLEPWRDMLAIGLTTFAEKPEPTRSDCHAWSASPVYELLATVCGIAPDAPGFRKVRIQPALGPLEWVEASMPHPAGEIGVRLKRKGDGGISGSIRLPEGLDGRLIWRGRAIELKGGEQEVDL